MNHHTTPTDNNFLISPRYRADKWRQLNLTSADSPDWKKAVDIFYDRINGRFLAPVDSIEKHPDTNIRCFSGFSILAIDCLLIETLYQFYNGVDETDIAHQKAFWSFFHASTFFNPHFNRKLAYKFYSHFRCGILHQAQTKMASKVKILQPKMVQLVDQNDVNQGLIIDREKFHEALRCEINDYVDRLRNPRKTEDYTLRTNFKKKMSYIVQ